MKPSPSDPVNSPIRWPEDYTPARANVFASTELLIRAPAETVWSWLIRAEDWNDWYLNASDIHLVSHAGPNLRERSRFRWKTFGASIASKVLEFEPCSRIAWDAHGLGIRAYHAWLLTPQPDGDTLVLTQITQTGWRVRLRRLLMPGRMPAMHRLWLEGLAAKAEAGPPPQ